MLIDHVGFCHLEFEKAIRVVQSEDGFPFVRQVAVGMPRLRTGIERSVFFLHGLDSESGRIVGPKATGFLVTRHSDVLQGIPHFYAVSNRHAVNPWSYIAIELKDGGHTFLEFDPSEWTVSEKEDLAVVDVTDDLYRFFHHGVLPGPIVAIQEHDFVTPELIEKFNIGIGDDTFMLGLFTDHVNNQRTSPVGRFGNLSAIPHKDMNVSAGYNDDRSSPAFLNDMRSRSGFSGSPVWAWRTPYTDLNGYGGATFGIHAPGYGFLRLVGIHRGQFQETTEITFNDSIDNDSDRLEANIASSMTVIVPAWCITDLLNNERLQQQRAVRDRLPHRIEMAKQAANFRRFQE